jgi:hypothetical protein
MRELCRDRLLLLLQPEQQQPRQMASPRFMCPSCVCACVRVCVCVCVPVCMAGVCVCACVWQRQREGVGGGSSWNGKLVHVSFLLDDHARARRECVCGGRYCTEEERVAIRVRAWSGV